MDGEQPGRSLLGRKELCRTATVASNETFMALCSSHFDDAETKSNALMIPVKSEGVKINVASNCKMRQRTMIAFITPKLVVTICWPMYTKSLHVYLRLSKHPHNSFCLRSHDVHQA